MEQRMSGFCIQQSRVTSSAERKGGSYGGSCGGATTGTGTKCGRWNPTAEQVQVLTDLFRAGLRTPTTEQIQKISTQLSFYGKIESKNVFYWFQNHKARERQKRRRVSKDTHPSSCFQLENHQLHKQAPLSSTKYLAEIHTNEAANYEGERERETLELFPMKESEKLSLWMLSRESKENSDHNNNQASFCYSNNYNFAREIDHHPPLDLRLSFF